MWPFCKNSLSYICMYKNIYTYWFVSFLAFHNRNCGVGNCLTPMFSTHIDSGMYFYKIVCFYSHLCYLILENHPKRIFFQCKLSHSCWVIIQVWISKTLTCEDRGGRVEWYHKGRPEADWRFVRTTYDSSDITVRLRKEVRKLIMWQFLSYRLAPTLKIRTWSSS